MNKAQIVHVNSMDRLIKYCVSSYETGLMIKPAGQWKGKHTEK
jgi:hypothetical protein